MGQGRAFSTRAIHAKATVPTIPSEPVAPPLYQAASFAVPHLDAMDHMLDEGEKGFVYSRLANPTVELLENAIVDLEGAEAAMAFGSGMAAIHAALTGLLSAGDHVVAPASVYGGTYALLAQVLPRFGIRTSFVDNRDPGAWSAAIRPETKVVWAETVANPTLDIADLPALGRLAEGAGATLVVDATFTTPYLCRPLEQGAHVVVHSASKYLGGHGDLLGGLVVTDAARMGRIRPGATEIGGAMAPFVAWLVLRGLKTLALRMDRHCASALAVARFLEGHPKIARVLYPGLDAHPDHARAEATFGGRFGGMVSMEVAGGLDAARRVMDAFGLFMRAGSLGDAHSLALLPAATSHKKLGAEARRRAGIADGLVRLSIGLEDPEDLVRDLEQALERA